MSAFGLDRSEIIDFITMQENGSMVEAVMDEFPSLKTHEQVGRAWSHFKAEMHRAGGREKYISSLGVKNAPVANANTKQPPMRRTSEGLRDKLFDAIDSLHRGDITCSDAKAIAQLSKAICDTVALEIEAAKLRRENPETPHQPLRLGHSDDE